MQRVSDEAPAQPAGLGGPAVQPPASSVLTLTHIRKSFGGAHALRDANLGLAAGEVTALIGENGAGKSTLVKILCGLYQPDGGEIAIAGRPVRIHDAEHARRLGINVVHQECVVFDHLSVAENIFVSSRPRRGPVLAWNDMRKRAAAILHQLDAPFEPDTPAGQLSIAHKHLVQIARALTTQPRVMIMDEPTAALSHREVEDLFQITRRLKRVGCAILFISHKFEEIFALADRYTVFRDGASVGSGLVSQTRSEDLIRLMVGRSVEQLFPKPQITLGADVLRVESLSRANEFEDISFTVRAGEILGIYGLVGAGRTELAQALFGLSPADTGRILIDGTPVRISTPEDAVAHGLACVPEDRQGQGAILPFSIADNLSLPNLLQLAPRGLRNRERERRLARQWMSTLEIKARGPEQTLAELSGGNQQKVVLGKWLARAPRVLILDEPTKGIDVGAKAAVHSVTGEFARAGNAVVMISSELPEILGMADRILVMRRGRAVTLLDRSEATAENVVQAATQQATSPAPASAPTRAPAQQAAVPPVMRQPARKHTSHRRELGLALLLLFLIGGVSLAFPGFSRPHNLAQVLDDTAILILLALGQMLVILTRGIDLSIAANLALSGMIAALFNRSHPDAGVVPAMLVATACGAVCGSINGGLVWKLRLPPIVVTLGTLSIYRGTIFLLSHGTWVHDNEMSNSFLHFVRAQFLGLSSLSWLAVCGFAVVALALRFSTVGRNLYAAGDNPSAASYSGIDPGRMQFIAYVVCGAIGGLCGYLWVARFAVAYTDIALGFELQVIAACLIGGIAISGGAGTALQALLGCLFLGVIRNALPLVGISPFWQMGINGLVIVVAALLSAHQPANKRAILEEPLGEPAPVRHAA
ncbi:MAG TPA: ATP-binding cassette domain-containing protein [Steroidobacteraceae bacterium]|jgi:ABC-type sugar transport system ATPase subunit/ribose/xylose/arabinose/galactoside ABC-type transport system permease subunit